MSEYPPIKQENEIILFDGSMLEIEEMHGRLNSKNVTYSFLSDNRTVKLRHKNESPNRYEFCVPIRDYDEHIIFSERIYSVNVFDEVDTPHALLSVYKRINPAKNLGGLALEWEQVHRTTSLGVPTEIERIEFEKIFGDYCEDIEESEQK